jgi:hypothetical protein
VNCLQWGDSLNQTGEDLWSSEVEQDWAKGCWIGHHSVGQGMRP